MVYAPGPDPEDELTLIASLASVLVNGSIRASSVIHERLLKCLFAADITFFDTQPLGRIMNRLSQDISVLDERIMNAMDGLFVAAGALLATVTVLVFTSPYLLVAMGLVIAMCYHVFTMYRVYGLPLHFHVAQD